MEEKNSRKKRKKNARFRDSVDLGSAGGVGYVTIKI